jgi:vacuolar-type H+-ATPase subunit I/STV1
VNAEWIAQMREAALELGKAIGERFDDIDGVLAVLKGHSDKRVADEVGLWIDLAARLQKIEDKIDAIDGHIEITGSIEKPRPERVQELLEHNNELLERARKAEAVVQKQFGTIEAAMERIDKQEKVIADLNVYLEAVKSVPPGPGRKSV